MLVVPTPTDSLPLFLPTTQWARTSVSRTHSALLRVTRHFIASVVGLVVLVGGATSTLATPVTLNVNGAVSSVDPLLASFFSVGDSMTSSFTYESSVGPPLVCQPATCAFDAITAYSFTVGGFSVVGSSGQVHLTNLYPDFTPFDAIDFLGEATGTPSLPGFRSDRDFVVSLIDSTGTALIDEFTLPTSVNVADFDPSTNGTDFGTTRWFLGFSRISDGQFAFVTGTLSVPEPDTLWLTVIGMIGLAGLIARRQRGARDKKRGQATFLGEEKVPSPIS